MEAGMTSNTIYAEQSSNTIIYDYAAISSVAGLIDKPTELKREVTLTTSPSAAMNDTKKDLKTALHEKLQTLRDLSSASMWRSSELESKRELDALVGEVKETLSNYFPGVALVLRHQIDPEDGSVQLILSVKAGRSEPSYASLDKFKSAWWSYNRHRADGQLLVKIDG
jgi:hypothetical protein